MPPPPIQKGLLQEVKVPTQLDEELAVLESVTSLPGSMRTSLATETIPLDSVHATPGAEAAEAVAGAWESPGRQGMPVEASGVLGSEGSEGFLGYWKVDVRNISGEGFLIRIPASNTGKDLQQMIALQIPQKPGTRISLQHESKKLLLHKGLREQGFQGEVTLSYVYTQLDLPGAWEYLLGFQEKHVNDDEMVLEGITQIHGFERLRIGENGKKFSQCLDKVALPSSLQSLSFGNDFDQSLQNINLPSSLQSLTFGLRFNQSLKNVTLPSSLQSLTFGLRFNQSLENVTWPSSLQSLTFGNAFDQSLENVTLPGSLQSLTFGLRFNQSLENVTLPSSLQSLTFGNHFDQSVEWVTLPSSLQSLTFGFRFNQSLENVTLPISLQSLTFGDDFDQSLENVSLPSSLQSLTFGMHFNQGLQNITLPSSLQSLTLANHFDQSLENVTLPSSLQSLTFGDVFDQSLENVSDRSVVMAAARAYINEAQQMVDGLLLDAVKAKMVQVVDDLIRKHSANQNQVTMDDGSLLFEAAKHPSPQQAFKSLLLTWMLGF
eukprot:symbB.v1.2.026924.t1/scaffold2730.1/size72026/8